MNARTKTEPMIRGTATHRRTEGDYMRELLDTVTLEAWRDVVDGALQAAKCGDAHTRAWLAQYLVGKPAGQAPTPLTVVVQQLSGDDPVIAQLAQPSIDRFKYPGCYGSDDAEEAIKVQIAAELSARIEGEP